MAKRLALFIEDGRTGGIRYRLEILEHPKSLERYEVRAIQLPKGNQLWSERFTTFTNAAERFVDELTVMARDYDMFTHAQS